MKKEHTSHKRQSSRPSTKHTPDLFQPRPFAPTPETQTPTTQTPDLNGPISGPSLRTFSIQDPNGPRRQPIQPKLTIGAPGDKYEQEADRVASQVVQQIHAPQTNAPLQRDALEANKLQMRPILQRNTPEEDELQRSPMLQRLEMPEEDELQRKPLLQRNTLEEDELQMRPTAESVSGGAASESLESAISQARGSGQSLDPNLQQQMGQAIGADFSGVKVHTDTQSDQMNRSIQAKAFTTGQDIFFRQGAYQPGSRDGQELIAHELTHVVQQNQNYSGEVRGKLIQRTSDTGLAQPKLAESFVGKALDIFRGWVSLNERDRLRALVQAVNEELDKINVPNVTGIIDPLSNMDEADNASFVRGNWQIWFNSRAFADDADQSKLNRLANTIYHETRHAEQTYRVARMMAQQGDDAQSIANSLNIHVNIATQAVANPLQAPGEEPKVFGKDKWRKKKNEWDEAKAWGLNIIPSTTGGSALSDIVNTRKDKVMEDYRKISAAYWYIQNNPDDDKVKKITSKQIENLKVDYIKAREYAKQAYLQYAKMPVEEDAWSVGGMIEELLGQEASTPEKQLENLAEDVRTMLPVGSGELMRLYLEKGID